jgi:hypothetical protein
MEVRGTANADALPVARGLDTQDGFPSVCSASIGIRYTPAVWGQ